MSWLFAEVQNRLQNREFTSGNVRVCPSLFVWVGVLLVYIPKAVVNEIGPPLRCLLLSIGP